MKDQKAVLHKCIKNDRPAFVISGTDECAIETMQAYYEIAKSKGCKQEFLEDMQLVIEEMKVFQDHEPELVRLPD